METCALALALELLRERLRAWACVLLCGRIPRERSARRPRREREFNQPAHWRTVDAALNLRLDRATALDSAFGLRQSTRNTTHRFVTRAARSHPGSRARGDGFCTQRTT